MIDKGMTKEAILTKLKALQSNDLKPKGGSVWAYVYDSGLREAEEVAMEAYQMYMDHNGLDFTVFPSLKELENEIVGTIAALFSREPETLAGTFTSGGTESIILAVKAARDYARVNHPEITHPEIILPITAHAAFHKAAHYLDIQTVSVPVDETTYQVDPQEIEKHITANTIFLVASSVNYSHGVSDPVEDLSKIAKKHNIWLHVDACIGGFLLAYYKKLGHPVKPFDFSLPGVSSLSVDLHKHAYTPKGASIVLYRNKQIRRHQFYACTDWTGYPVINTTIQSTKSGGPLAACWATLNYIGDAGYKNLTEKVWHTKEQMIHFIQQMEDLYVLGEPEASLLALGSDTIDLFQLADEMKKDGWYIQIQPGTVETEPSIHLTITPASGDQLKAFFTELKRAIAFVKNHPRESLAENVDALLASHENMDLSDDAMAAIMQAAGVKEDGSLPEDMAAINELLHLLPPDITKEAFLQLTNELFTPNKSVYKGVE